MATSAGVKLPGQEVRASILLPPKRPGRSMGREVGPTWTFLGISLTSQAFPVNSQGPVELGREVFHLQFPAERGSLDHSGQGFKSSACCQISFPAALSSTKLNRSPNIEHLAMLEKNKCITNLKENRGSPRNITGKLKNRAQIPTSAIKGVWVFAAM